MGQSQREKIGLDSAGNGRPMEKKQNGSSSYSYTLKVLTCLRFSECFRYINPINPEGNPIMPILQMRK